MTPEGAIASLDRQIARHGQPITLRRVVANAPAIEATLYGFVRGYRPDELVGGIQQGDTEVVLSPSRLKAAGWMSDPKRLDKVIVAGRIRNVENAVPIYIRGTVVRYNLQVRG